MTRRPSMRGRRGSAASALLMGYVAAVACLHFFPPPHVDWTTLSGAGLWFLWAAALLFLLTTAAAPPFGALIHSLALERLTGEVPAAHRAREFAARRVPDFALPVGALALGALALIGCVVLWSFLSRLSILLLVLGAFPALVLLGTAALLMRGWLVGYPLLVATIACEATDPFDAVARTYSYVAAAPLRYAADLAGSFGRWGLRALGQAAGAGLALALAAAAVRLGMGPDGNRFVASVGRQLLGRGPFDPAAALTALAALVWLTRSFAPLLVEGAATFLEVYLKARDRVDPGVPLGIAPLAVTLRARPEESGFHVVEELPAPPPEDAEAVVRS